MESNNLFQILEENVDSFLLTDKANAHLIRRNLKNWSRSHKSVELLEWWKEKGQRSIAALQSYLFWLMRNAKLPYMEFEDMYTFLTPVLSTETSLPIEITDGLDYPLFHEGFFGHEFTLFGYRFTPADKGLLVTFTVPSQAHQPRYDLEQLLDIFSYLLDCNGHQALGFRPINKRAWHTSITALISSGVGPESRLLPDYDFKKIEVVLSQFQFAETDQGLSLEQLLRVRHRAVLDSNLESKLITLWSAIEEHWGERDHGDQLITAEEKRQMKKHLAFLGESKVDKVIQKIAELKIKTKNQRISEGVRTLACIEGYDADRLIKEIHGFRSKFAHGKAMDETERKRVLEIISIAMQILNEEIEHYFSVAGIAFKQTS